jgi:hypothetical protein
LLKRPKQIRRLERSLAFPGQKHALAHAFQVNMTKTMGSEAQN